MQFISPALNIYVISVCNIDIFVTYACNRYICFCMDTMQMLHIYNRRIDSLAHDCTKKMRFEKQIKRVITSTSRQWHHVTSTIRFISCKVGNLLSMHYRLCISFVQIQNAFNTNLRCCHKSISCSKILVTSRFALATESASKVSDTTKCGDDVLHIDKSTERITPPAQLATAFLKF